MNPNHNFLSLRLWIPPGNWSGKHWRGWYVGLAQTRDSEIIERSNFECFLAAVQEAGKGRTIDDSANDYIGDWSETPTVYVVREGHWACGWVEWVAIHESDEAACQTAEELLNSLESHPILDEEHLSELEREAEQEDWRSWLRRELIRSLPEDEELEGCPTLHEWVEDAEDSVLWGAYRAAMDETNTCWSEDSLPLDRIAGVFEEHLRRLKYIADDAARKAEAEAAGQLSLEDI